MTGISAKSSSFLCVSPDTVSSHTQSRCVCHMRHERIKWQTEKKHMQAADPLWTKYDVYYMAEALYIESLVKVGKLSVSFIWLNTLYILTFVHTNHMFDAMSISPLMMLRDRWSLRAPIASDFPGGRYNMYFSHYAAIYCKAVSHIAKMYAQRSIHYTRCTYIVYNVVYVCLCIIHQTL